MDVIKIEGGNTLTGNVTVSGAKNACLPIFAAALLTDQTCRIENVPNLSDVHFMAKILSHLGATVNQVAPGTWEIEAKDISPLAPYDLVRKMRASVCLMGPMVARLGQAQVSLPGGCVFGQRPIDLHLMGLRKLGTQINLENGYVHLDAQKGLTANNIFLGGRQGSTVTGTANVLMAAVKAKGTTRIDSAACEPEIVDLCNMLTKMGAKIDGIGSHTLLVTGVDSLNGCTHSVIGDRIEAGTFLIAGLLGQNDVTVHGANVNHLRSLLHQLEGTDIQIIDDNTIRATGSAEKLQAREIVTLPYPGFPTDLQAQMTTLLALTPGMSVITERIYASRFMHVPELLRMGAHISIEGPSAIINGQPHFSGAPVMASDLRASAALLLAGLMASGTTHVHRVYHLDRGYENIDQKLAALGANISRIAESESPLQATA